MSQPGGITANAEPLSTRVLPAKAPALKEQVAPVKAQLTDHILPYANKVTDYWTSSQWFSKLIRKAFKECDMDKSGSLNEAELYICLLRIYEEVNIRLPTHVKAPRRPDVKALLKKHDTDKDGVLSFNEFSRLARKVFGVNSLRDSVAVHVTVVLLMRMALLPFITSMIFSMAKMIGGYAEVLTYIPSMLYVLVMEICLREIWASTFAS